MTDINAKQINTQDPIKKGRGRPAKIEMPALPVMDMSDGEAALQTYFIESFRLEYPDLTNTDMILLHLASLEYIKYLRVVAEELSTGKVISQARQHPGVNMRALLDQMAVTRKARSGGTRSQEDKSIVEARQQLLDMSD